MAALASTAKSLNPNHELRLMRLLLGLLLSLALTLAPRAEAKPIASCQKQTKFLSDTDSIYQALERQQHDIYERNPDLQDPFLREVIRNEHSSLDETLAKLEQDYCKSFPNDCENFRAGTLQIKKELYCTPLPTRYESPFTYMILKPIVNSVERMQKEIFPDSKHTRFITLPTGRIDATAERIQGADAIIVNRDVFQFAHAFSKAVADALPMELGADGGLLLFTSEAQIEERLRQNPEIVANFALAVEQTITLGNASGVRQRRLDPLRTIFMIRFLSAMETFMVAHEISHGILKHPTTDTRPFSIVGGQVRMPPSANPSMGASPEQPYISLIQRNQKQELAADALGFLLLMKLQQQDLTDDEARMFSLGVGTASVDVFFNLVDLIDRYSVELEGASFTSRDHPSGAQRSEAIDAIFNTAVQSSAQSTLLAIQLRSAFRKSFAVLARTADPVVRELLKRRRQIDIGTAYKDGQSVRETYLTSQSVSENSQHSLPFISVTIIP